MNKYLKRNDGEVYGPVDLPALQLWAMDGRVAPDDKISADRETWTPASDLAELSMEWKVELDDGSIYGPIHILALRDLIGDGTVSRRAKIKHKQSGEEQVACEALLFELMKMESKKENIIAPAAGAPQAQVQDLREQLEKWKTLYQEEQSAAATREAEINALVQEVEKWKKLHARAAAEVEQMKSRPAADKLAGGEMVPRARIEDAERKRSQTERNYQQLLKTLNRSFGARAGGRPPPLADYLQRRDVS